MLMYYNSEKEGQKWQRQEARPSASLTGSTIYVFHLFSRQETLELMPPLAKILLVLGIIMMHGDVAIQPQQFHNPFLVLVMICGLPANASADDMVCPTDKESVKRAIGFLADWLLAVQSLAVGEETLVVSTQSYKMPQGFRRQCPCRYCIYYTVRQSKGYCTMCTSDETDHDGFRPQTLPSSIVGMGAL